MTKIVAILMMFLLAMPTSVSATSVTQFTDVSSSDWYYNAVEYATTNGLFSGTSDSAFSPNLSMTRGMFVTVLGRLANVSDSYGRTQSTPFNDVTQADYFFPYAVWANDNGIVSGVGNNSFNPNGEITREQMATILYRYAQKSGYPVEYSTDKCNAFEDITDVSAYAIIALQWTTTHDIIKGADNKISPQNNAKRAEVAQIFLNFSKLEKTAIITPQPTNTPIATAPPNDWENYNPTYTLPTGKSAIDEKRGYYDYDLANEIMEQVNALRVKTGVEALSYHPKIQEWAGVRAKEQSVIFSHTRPDGSLYSSVGVGLSFENITILTNVSSSQLSDKSNLAERAVNNWFTSTKGHKEAMLSHAPNIGAVSCYVIDDEVCIIELFSNRTLYFYDYLIN